MHKDTRQHLRTLRRQIPADTARRAAEQIAANALSLPELKASQHVGIYLAHDGEVDTAPLMDQLHQLKKTLYLPVLDPHSIRQLRFVPYQPGDPLHANRYHILEPAWEDADTIDVAYLDSLIMPLVGFDRKGQRLGRGGGYYDQTLAFRLSAKHAKPYCMGLAYALQEVSIMEQNSWDVPLDAVVTEEEVLIYFARL
jgi:5,10-methenyltetrahydrofolate synthetase